MCLYLVGVCVTRRVWAPSVSGSVAVCGWPEAYDSRFCVCVEDTELSWYIVMVLSGRFGGNLRVWMARPWCRGMGRVGVCSSASGIAHACGATERTTRTHNFS